MTLAVTLAVTITLTFDREMETLTVTVTVTLTDPETVTLTATLQAESRTGGKNRRGKPMGLCGTLVTRIHGEGDHSGEGPSALRT